MKRAVQLEVLDAENPEQRERWLGLWKSGPQREVFAHPDYVRLFAHEGERPLAATGCVDGDCRVLYPLVLRPLTTLDWTEGEEPGWDFVTPYGYGGPFLCGPASSQPKASETECFWDAFDTWAAEAGIVTGFSRLSLFDDELLPFRGEVKDLMPNAIRWLDRDADAMWLHYAHKVRKNVKRARREGLVAVTDTKAERLGDFLDIYYATMDRRQASDSYYFAPEFFERLCRDLAEQTVFFHVLHGDEVVSSELVLLSTQRMYSFLGGTRAEAFPMRPNDLLKHHAICWGLERGMDAYVLGGGPEPADGIYRYKMSFAREGERVFRTGYRVFDPAEHDRLIERRSETSAEGSWTPREGFLPAYRS